MYFDGVNTAGGAASYTFRFVGLDDKADPREGTLVEVAFAASQPAEARLPA